MEVRTRDHLGRAVQNQEVAHHLLHVQELNPPPYERVVVVAFYAAVHYANAYFWERQRYELASHHERLRAFSVVPSLRPVYRDYAGLQSIAFESRYLPHFEIAEADALDYVQHSLTRIERVIVAELQ